MSYLLNPPSAADRFVKLGADRIELAADATEGHLATLDKCTGLAHAVGVCPQRISPSAAKKLAAKLNKEKYAGIDTWTVPTRHASFSIVIPGKSGPATDTDFFPDAQSDWYWTCEDHPSYPSYVFVVHFGDGDVSSYYRHDEAFCRPVASVPASQ